MEGEVVFFVRLTEILGEKMHACGHTSLSSTLKEQVTSRFGTSLTCLRRWLVPVELERNVSPKKRIMCVMGLCGMDFFW